MNTSSETDREKQVFLYTMARLCLQKLHIDFTEQFLKQAIAQAYQSTMEINYPDAEDENKVSVADKEDPSNLAIVLLDALKRYHIKNEVCDTPANEPNSVTLIIFSKQQEEQNYRQLLHLMGTDHSPEKNSVENYVTLRRSKFTGEPDYILNRNSGRIKKAAGFIISALLSLALALSVYNGIGNYKLTVWIPLLTILFTGCAVCYHLFKLEKTNTYASSFLKKICTSEKNNFGCKQVISSAASRLFGIISQTDIGIVYFSSLLSFTVAGLLANRYENHLSILFWTAVLPLPYTVFPVYYQLRVIKKICILCMVTQTLLWIQFGYFIFIREDIAIWTIHPESAVEFSLIMATLSLLYFFLLQNQKNRDRLNALSSENLKFKNTEALFENSMAGQKQFIDPEIPAALILGDPLAKIKLNAILSLSCAPCANKLKDLLKLQDWFENAICINILLKADKYSASILKNLLTYSQNGNTEQAAGALAKWYDFFLNAKAKGAVNLSTIAAAWEKQNPSTGWAESIENLYALHEQCYKTHPIPFTPLIEYNGRLLANPYHDIELLSNRIEQHLE
jgi:uncharacterized membrane protein